MRYSYVCILCRLQLPFTRGADLAFDYVVPLLDKYFRRMPVAHVSSEQQSLVLNLLVAVGVLNSQSRNRLVEIMDTGGPLILVSLPFLISPSFVTKIGVLLVGLAFPAHSSAAVVRQKYALFDVVFA